MSQPAASAASGSSVRGSLRSGAPPRGPPRHQNAFAFKHNTNSKKTAIIKKISHTGLCERCDEIIEWKKKYRKYRPLKAPAVCSDCHQKTVKRAYHVVCDGCAKKAGICAKCRGSYRDEPEVSEAQDDGASTAGASALPRIHEPTDEELAGLRERERRTVVRQYRKARKALAMGDEEALEAAIKATQLAIEKSNKSKGEDDEFGDEDFDDDEDEEDEDEEEEEEELAEKLKGASLNKAKKEAGEDEGDEEEEDEDDDLDEL